MSQISQALTENIEIDTTPQIALPQVATTVIDSVAPVQVRRAEINLVEPATFRELPPQFRPQPVRQVIPAAALSEADSLNLNLKGSNVVSVNWFVEFEEDYSFHETQNSLIASWVFESTSAEVPDSLLLAADYGLKSDSISLQTIVEKESLVSPQLAKEKSPLQYDWFIGILAFSVLITGFTRVNWSKYLQDTLQSIIYPEITSKLSSTNASNFPPSFILGFLFYFNSSIFLYQVFTLTDKSTFGLTGAVTLPIIFSFLLVLFTAKIIAYRVVGRVFNTDSKINNYLTNSSASSKAFGILLLPVILFLPFVEQHVQPLLVKFGIGIFITLYIIQVARGIKMNFTNLLSGYYIILYLCALEILPLALLFKVLFK